MTEEKVQDLRATLETATQLHATRRYEELERNRKQQRLDDLQFARQVEDTFGIPYLLQKLEEYPDEIRHQQNAIMAAEQAVAEAQEELEYQEAILKAAIISEVSASNGKPLYPNEEARKAEFICRKKASPEYQAAAAALRTAEEALKSARFDSDRLLNQFSACRSVARIAAGRLGLVGK